MATSVSTSTPVYDDMSGSGYEYDYDYLVTLPPPEASWDWKAVSVFYFLLFFLGFLGNVLVLLVLGVSRGPGGRLVDTFVRHLAFADLVFVSSLPLWAVSAMANYRWDFGESLCRISSWLVAVNRVSNVCFLTCMSLDRYLSVVRRLDWRRLAGGRCADLTCAGVWAVALALGAPSLYFRRLDKLSMCVDPESSVSFQAYSLLMVLLAFVLPVSTILLCYSAICLHLQHHCALNTHPYLHPRTHARRRHTLKIVFAIVTAFVVSWLPFSVCRSWVALAELLGVGLGAGLEAGLRQALVLSSCLAFVNSCANPAIYLLLDRHFRRHATHLLRRHSNAPDSLTSPTADSLSGSTHTHTRSRLASLSLKA